MGQTYLIGDTHFGHTNIIRFCDRPFNDTHHMNTTMMQNWNSIVRPDDRIIHLGDFAMGMRNPDTMTRQLNGRKLLVRGNHDKEPARMLKWGWDFVIEELIIKVKNRRYLLRHYPIKNKEWLIAELQRTKCVALIHGHIHNNEGEEVMRHRQINVSAEVINYTPINIKDIHDQFTTHEITEGLIGELDVV